MKIKKSYVNIAIFALLLAILACLFKPTKGYDLFEYHLWIDRMFTFNLMGLIKYIFYRLEFIIMTYFYVIGLIGNHQLIPLIPTFVFYFIIFYIIYDYSKEKNIKKKYIIITYLFFMSLFKYISIVSNLRYSLAYMIFTLAIYLDMIKKNKRKYVKVLYIIPIFIHTSSVILLFFRILINFKNKKLMYIFLFLTSIGSYFPNFIINILSYFQNIGMVDFFIERLKMYLIDENIPVFNQYIFRIVQLLLIFILAISLYKKNKTKFNFFFMVISIFTIIVIPFYTLFSRLNDFVLFLSIISLIDLYSKYKKIPKTNKLIFNLILFILIIAGIKIQIPIFKQMYF